jgi:hypothetical protein
LSYPSETVAPFENRAGWNIKKLLTNLSSILNYNIDGLNDICREIGIVSMAIIVYVVYRFKSENGKN